MSIILTSSGEVVSVNEQTSLTVEPSLSLATPTTNSGLVAMATGESAPPLLLKELEEERTRLYQQLDEKVCQSCDQSCDLIVIL